jgi:NhaP-type Na+/H+ or K+/H+ antiporter
MNEAIFFIAGGILVMLAAWMPLFLERVPVSLAMLAVALGAAVPLFTEGTNPLVNYNPWMEHVSEFALLVAVLGAGLKIDRPFSFRGWASTWRLLLPVMLLSIVAIAFLGWLALGLSFGFAVLLAAILAPTDPVLAASVQVGPPGAGDEDEASFALTSEAGLNDGLAFPFVMLGLAIIEGTMQSFPDFMRWLSVEMIWDVGGGAGLGIAIGWGLVSANRFLPERLRLSSTNSGLVCVGLAFLAYGFALACEANGFVAVFCEAVTLRNLVRSYDYSRRLSNMAGQFERVAVVIIFAAMGIAVSRGLLSNAGWNELLFSFAVLLIVRPAAVFLGFIGSKADIRTRLALGYFGIRGVGSLYYISYVVTEVAPDPHYRLAMAVVLVVLISVVLYGLTTDAAIRLVLRRP